MLWDDPPFAPHGATEDRPQDGLSFEGGIPGTKFPGGHRSRVTPVPSPNTEVKPATADGTARAGGWESRSLPGINYQSPSFNEDGLFLFAPFFLTRQRHIDCFPHDHAYLFGFIRSDPPTICIRQRVFRFANLPIHRVRGFLV